jgi:putative flippase GtrA
MKTIAGEFTGFLVVGAVNTDLTYVLFLVLVAYTVASVVGMSYVLNALFVFKGRHSTGAMFKFPFVYVFQISRARWRSSRSSIAKPVPMLIVIATSVVMTFVLVRLAFHGQPAGAQLAARQGPS